MRTDHAAASGYEENRDGAVSIFGSGRSPMTIGLQHDADGRPQVTLTIKDDDGKDLVYLYEPVGAAAAAVP